ncbi:MAG: uroporphyrinogen-III C-methyltransferase [Candidatus Electryonea clarkiae]|nr:uroporphyrinogen-III C-methyltransferase [Candidatus Electryonea clarkiae]MDP8286300.1 uroporphyrinogen-III C-methyltransferase [Candidatus Electryonea clarkiae]
MSKQSGKVYLIGAGPGEPGLITYRGLEVLASVDAVCYDALLDPTLIITLPSHIERYYVGKRSGKHSQSQGNIENLLIRLAREGKNIARLKAGDPMIFGRGGEELEALKDAGIPYEIVPGVTAATAVAAYAGIPLTHRDYASWTTLFTAHESTEKENSDMLFPYDRLASMGDGTLVGYMGIKRLAKVVEELIEGGMSPETPSAIIERGATQAQRIIGSPLIDLPQAAENAGVEPPGLIVIGKVVGLSEKLSWFESAPLSGKRVLVTRPASQAGSMYELLRINGASIVPAPSIRTESFVDNRAWDSFFEKKSEGGWIVFTSENGVRYFVQQLFQHQHDWRTLGNFKIAAIGTGTAKAMREIGLKADFIPSKFTTDTLAGELALIVEKDENVIRVRGNLGEPNVEESLEKSGANVLPLQVYETIIAQLDDGIRAWVNEAPIDIITFTSGSTATSFIEQWGREEAIRIASKAVIASIGPFTSDVVRSIGFEVTIEAETHSIEGIIDAILIWVKKNQ